MSDLKPSRFNRYDYLTACSSIGSVLNDSKKQNIPVGFLEKGMYNILGLNDILYAIVIDIENYLVKHNLYRFKTKQIIKDLRTRIEVFNKKVWNEFDKHDTSLSYVLADYNDLYFSKIEESYTGYKRALLSQIETYNTGHDELVLNIAMFSDMVRFIKETTEAYSIRAKEEYSLTSFNLFDVISINHDLIKRNDELMSSIYSIDCEIRISGGSVAKAYNIFMKKAVSNDAVMGSLNTALEMYKLNN